jgi:hypothetical protein
MLKKHVSKKLVQTMNYKKDFLSDYEVEMIVVKEVWEKIGTQRYKPTIAEVNKIIKLWQITSINFISKHINLDGKTEKEKQKAINKFLAELTQADLIDYFTQFLLINLFRLHRGNMKEYRREKTFYGNNSTDIFLNDMFPVEVKPVGKGDLQSKNTNGETISQQIRRQQLGFKSDLCALSEGIELSLIDNDKVELVINIFSKPLNKEQFKVFVKYFDYIHKNKSNQE